LSPIASFGDKLRVARLKREVCSTTLEELYDRPEVTTHARLIEKGFSNRIIEHFFRPFLGGVFLENALNTSSRKFEFVFRMFADGQAALPAKGMGALPNQLAGKLPPGSVRANARVDRITGDKVWLKSGKVLSASRIVVACEAPAAAKLFGHELSEKNSRENENVHNGHDVTCLYFAADKPPLKEPILLLNGEGKGPINSFCVPSQVAPGYAPQGQSLISVTVLGTNKTAAGELRKQVLDQLRDWFGSPVNDWRFLKLSRIPDALPSQAPPTLTPVEKPVIKNGVFVCGDYLDTASIQGAMASGRRAADAVVASL
jgi:protoporphyrinogen oxidase